MLSRNGVRPWCGPLGRPSSNLLTSGAQLAGLLARRRSRRGRFFRQGGVLVRHLVELADKLVDLANAPPCWWTSVAMVEIRPETLSTAVVTSAVVWPARPTCCVPEATLASEVWMRVLMSLAAAALRPARARTSLATTAKPGPARPRGRLPQRR